MLRICLILLLIGLTFDTKILAAEDSELYPQNRDLPRDKIVQEIANQYADSAHFGVLKTDIVGSDDLAIHIHDDCQDHISEEADKLKNGKYESESEWIAHIAECKKCCGPLMAQLGGIYVERVSKLPHMVIFFDHDSDKLKKLYHNKLNAFFKNNIIDGGHVFLIGRASIAGTPKYNRVLSGKRVSEVRRFFLKLGAKQNQLTRTQLGISPPRITKRILTKYGVIEKDYEHAFTPISNNPSSFKMNQSVVVVAY